MKRFKDAAEIAQIQLQELYDKALKVPEKRMLKFLKSIR